MIWDLIDYYVNNLTVLVKIIDHKWGLAYLSIFGPLT